MSSKPGRFHYRWTDDEWAEWYAARGVAGDLGVTAQKISIAFLKA